MLVSLEKHKYISNYAKQLKFNKNGYSMNNIIFIYTGSFLGWTKIKTIDWYIHGSVCTVNMAQKWMCVATIGLSVRLFAEREGKHAKHATPRLLVFWP